FLHQANPRVIVSTGLQRSPLSSRFLRSPFCWRFLGRSRQRCTAVIPLTALASWRQEASPARERFSYLSHRMFVTGLTAVSSVNGCGSRSSAPLEQSCCARIIWLLVSRQRGSHGS